MLTTQDIRKLSELKQIILALDYLVGNLEQKQANYIMEQAIFNAYEENKDKTPNEIKELREKYTYIDSAFENLETLPQQMESAQQDLDDAQSAIVQFYDYLANNDMLARVVKYETQNLESATKPETKNQKAENIARIMYLMAEMANHSKNTPQSKKIDFIQESLVPFLQNIYMCMHYLSETDEHEQNRQFHKERITVMRHKWENTTPLKKNDFVTNAFLPNIVANNKIDKHDIMAIRLNAIGYAFEAIHKYLTDKYINNKKQKITDKQIVAIENFENTRKYFNSYYYKYLIKNNNQSRLNNTEPDDLWLFYSTLKCRHDKNTQQESAECLREEMKYSSLTRANLFDMLCDLLPPRAARTFKSLGNQTTEDLKIANQCLDDEIFYNIVFIGRDLGYPNETIENVFAALSNVSMDQFLRKTDDGSTPSAFAKAMSYIKTKEKSQPTETVLDKYDILRPTPNLLNFISEQIVNQRS